jgi:hypothetical protein
VIPLPSERDQNFLLYAASGAGYVHIAQNDGRFFREKRRWRRTNFNAGGRRRHGRGLCTFPLAWRRRRLMGRPDCFARAADDAIHDLWMGKTAVCFRHASPRRSFSRLPAPSVNVT